MGKRGPQKKPTAILKLHGSRKVEQRKNEPKPPAGGPICPVWLTGEPRKVWQRITPKLKRMGVVSTIDGFALARYCLYVALWMNELNKKAGRSELTMNRYANQLNRLEQAFGLTPSARAGLKVEQQLANEDPLQKFLKRTAG